MAGRFVRIENRRRARTFVLGLLAGLPRKNCWTIAEHAGEVDPHGSAMNLLSATVASVTEIGNRARVGLATPQPLVAEVTGSSVRRMGLGPGVVRLCLGFEDPSDLEADLTAAFAAAAAAREPVPAADVSS